MTKYKVPVSNLLEAKIVTAYEIIEWMNNKGVHLKDHLKLLIDEYRERLLVEEDVYYSPQQIILKRLLQKETPFETLLLDETKSNYIMYSENFD